MVQKVTCRAARQWGISLSQPRLWATDRLTATLERELARLVSQEQALLFSSTMQIAHDVLPVMAGPGGVILMDECAYPISQRAALAATRNGVTLCRFQHNDLTHLARLLGRVPGTRDKVIVSDGLYMASGERAPVAGLVDLAKRHGATIYLDDAQGIGLLGRMPSESAPYGFGGGGAPAFCNVQPGLLAHAGTLAKALGVPLAFIAGPGRFIEYLRLTAFSHVHCSPPALPVIAAALAALQVHAAEGDRRRRHLVRLVRLYQSGVAADGPAPAFPWPMQTIYFGTSRDTLAAGASLRRSGIWPVVQLRPEDNPAGGALRFIFTAAHHVDDVMTLLRTLTTIVDIDRLEVIS